jgi:putative membrane protein
MQWWAGASDGAWSWTAMVLPMMLWPVVVIGGIIMLAVMLTRRGTTAVPMTSRDGRRQTPFDILRERFARGEIDRHEYEERKGLLSQP